MKTLKMLFATLLMFAAINACTPNHEEVIPTEDTEKKEAFHVKSTEDEGDAAEGNRPSPR